jgi:hypothetical protein
MIMGMITMPMMILILLMLSPNMIMSLGKKSL